MPMSPRLLRPIANNIDPDAAVYLNAVAAADTQQLEPAVRKAINDFVVGCKRDGIWDAIKASCLLMGARTLSGALVPLRGAAPGNVNFVSGDYDRKTGLKGNGTNKRITSGRNNNADPQDNQHIAFYQSERSSDTATRGVIGVGINGSGATHYASGSNTMFARSRSATAVSGGSDAAGFFCMSRSASGSYLTRAGGSNTTQTNTSNTPENAEIWVFNRNGAGSVHTDARLAFYSIGESLDLALLDARVSALYTAIGAAI
jgi:hypothetical protein